MEMNKMETKPRLSLQVGDELQLQLIANDSEDRYAVQVIGYVPGQSLLVTAPRHKGKAMVVWEGQRIAVRALQGGTILGFISHVLQSRSLPYPYIHLSYPTDVERIVVRNALRVSLETPSQVRPSGQGGDEAAWVPVELIDLSTTGARLETTKELGKVGDPLQLKVQLGVCGEEEVLRLDCGIRNVTQLAEHRFGSLPAYRYGVEFHAIDRLHKLLLYSYVLEQRVNAG